MFMSDSSIQMKNDQCIFYNISTVLYALFHVRFMFDIKYLFAGTGNYRAAAAHTNS